MDAPDPLTALIDLERAIDQSHLAAQQHEARRLAGVTWSGLSAPPPSPRTEAQLRWAAEERLRRQNAWRGSPRGAALKAIAQIQRASEAAHAAAERARSAAARSLPHNTTPCLAALMEVREQTADLLRGLRQVRRALAGNNPPPPAD